MPLRSTQAAPAALFGSAHVRGGRPNTRGSARGVALQRPPQPKHRLPLPLQPPPRRIVGRIQLQANHRHRPVVLEVRSFRLAPPPRHHAHRWSRWWCRCRAAAMGLMKPQTTDIDPLPHRMAKPPARSPGSAPAKCSPSTRWPATAPTARPAWTLPLAVRVLLCLIHLRTNRTTQALAALFHTSQSASTASCTT